MSIRHFIANFFRQGTDESSTRLVGILSFMMAAATACFMVIACVIAAWIGGETHKNLYDPSPSLTTFMIATIGLLLTAAEVALGLRKAPDAEGGAAAPAPTEAKP